MKKTTLILIAIILLASSWGSVQAVDPKLIPEAGDEERTDGRGVWMSQKIEEDIRGMDIGDVDGDGRNEIVLITMTDLMIYRKEGNSLVLLQRIPGETHSQYLSVDVADINGAGIKQIIVTSLFRNFPESFVLEYRAGRYEKIASNLRWFLRVVRIDGKPVLLGQEMGINNPFDNPIYEIVWKNGRYEKGRRMRIPQGLSIYGLAILPLEKNGPAMVVAFDSYDYLHVYRETDRSIDRINALGDSRASVWKSGEVFGGSNNYFDRTLSQLSPPNPEDKDKMPYVNLRIVVPGADRTGMCELMIARNFSAEGHWFQNLRIFTSGEVYCMEWDSLGFAEIWKSMKMRGYIADYQVKDIDNDGRPEIVMAVLTSGYMSLRPTGMIVIYPTGTQ